MFTKLYACSFLVHFVNTVYKLSETTSSSSHGTHDVLNSADLAELIDHTTRACTTIPKASCNYVQYIRYMGLQGTTL